MLNKLIVLGIGLILIVSMLFGCVDNTDTTKVTNNEQANQTLTDAGTGLSNVKSTLDTIDAELTE